MMHSNRFVSSIKVNGKVMREHKDTIYLPFDSNFSIFLKNLNSQKAKVFISIDDEDILDGDALLINPNSELELKRWMIKGDNTSGPKLKFIEKTDSIREIRDEKSMDGIIKITYQYEKPVKPIDQFLPRYWYTDQNPYNPIFGSNSIDGGIVNSCDYQVQSFTASTNNEDGLTIKGEETQQEFKTGTIGTLEDEINVMCFNLKGDVNQEKIKIPVTVKTLKECSKCSKSNPWNANFCSVCGNNIKR